MSLKNHDTLRNNFQDNIDYLTNNIKENGDKISSIKIILSQLNKEIGERSSELSSFLQNNQRNLEEFKKKFGSFDSVNNYCDHILNTLKELDDEEMYSFKENIESSLFLQINSKVKLMKDILQTSIPEKMNKFSPILELIGEIKADKVDSSILKNLSDLMDKMKKMLESEKKITADEEEMRLSDYQKEKNFLEKKISFLNNRKIILSGSIRRRNSQNERLNYNLNEYKSLLEIASENYNLEKTKCENLKESYAKAKKIKNEEIESIQDFSNKLNEDIDI